MAKEINFENVGAAMKLVNKNGSKSYAEICELLKNQGFDWTIEDAKQYADAHDNTVTLGTGLLTGDLATGVTFIANCSSDDVGWSFCKEYIYEDYEYGTTASWVKAWEMEKQSEMDRFAGLSDKAGDFDGDTVGIDKDLLDTPRSVSHYGFSAEPITEESVLDRGRKIAENMAWPLERERAKNIIDNSIPVIAVKEDKKLAKVRTSLSSNGVGYVKYANLLGHDEGIDQSKDSSESKTKWVELPKRDFDGDTIVMKVKDENGEYHLRRFDVDRLVADVCKSERTYQVEQAQRRFDQAQADLAEYDFGDELESDIQLH